MNEKIAEGISKVLIPPPPRTPPRQELWQKWGKCEGNRQNQTYSRGPVNSTAKTTSLRLYYFESRCSSLGSFDFDDERAEIICYPARPLLTNTLTFTRRFSARPDADSLLAMGSALPIAPGATMCRTGTLQFSVK